MISDLEVLIFFSPFFISVNFFSGILVILFIFVIEIVDFVFLIVRFIGFCDVCANCFGLHCKYIEDVCINLILDWFCDVGLEF